MLSCVLSSPFTEDVYLILIAISQSGTGVCVPVSQHIRRGVPVLLVLEIKEALLGFIHSYNRGLIQGYYVRPTSWLPRPFNPVRDDEMSDKYCDVHAYRLL